MVLFARGSEAPNIPFTIKVFMGKHYKYEVCEDMEVLKQLIASLYIQFGYLLSSIIAAAATFFIL